MAETVEELRSLSDEELVRRHDAMAGHTVVGTQHYLDELHRRDLVRQGKRMERLTRSINILTIVIAVATLVGVGLTAWALLSGV